MIISILSNLENAIINDNSFIELISSKRSIFKIVTEHFINKLKDSILIFNHVEDNSIFRLYIYVNMFHNNFIIILVVIL